MRYRTRGTPMNDPHCIPDSLPPPRHQHKEKECVSAGGLCGLIGQSPAMRELFKKIRRVANTDATVVIVGESGTGKETVAENLHRLSPRCDGPFVAFNCGAIPPTLIEAELLGFEKGSFTGADRRRVGYFERASGGTIFLDEITEVPLDTQVKLLRVLENRSFQRVGGIETVEVDVRIIAATNRDVDMAIAEGRFREDLMYRLAVFPLRVAPLRERHGDIPLLAQHFLDQMNARENTSKKFSRHSLKQLETCDWPGNVRELKNLVIRGFILADDVIEFPTLGRDRHEPIALGNKGTLKIAIGTTLADVQKQLILATLEHCRGDKRRAARILGTSLKTLYNRLDCYRLRAPTDKYPQRR
jgi:DNA-binding NtrC family response regulator